jgi:hypothetical protein
MFRKAARRQPPITVRSFIRWKGIKHFLERYFSQIGKKIRQEIPRTSMAIIMPDAHPLVWYAARENGRRMSDTPARMRMRPTTKIREL